MIYPTFASPSVLTLVLLCVFQVPVQRVTKYPLLLSRLLKVTPAHHQDRSALQESRERIEHHLENMNQEARDTNSTRLWRRISMINVSSYRKNGQPIRCPGQHNLGNKKGKQRFVGGKNYYFKVSNKRVGRNKRVGGKIFANFAIF